MSGFLRLTAAVLKWKGTFSTWSDEVIYWWAQWGNPPERVRRSLGGRSGMEPKKQAVDLNLFVKCRAGVVAGVMWLEEGGRDAGVTSAAMAHQQPCIKSTPLVRSFRDGRCNCMGAFAYEKWLLNEFFICVFLWHPCLEEGYESHKASNGSESSLKLKLSLCTYLRRFFPSSFYSLDNVIIEQSYK